MPRVKVDDVEPDVPEVSVTSGVSTGGSSVKTELKEKNVSPEKSHGPHDNCSEVDLELDKASSQSMLSAFVSHPPGIFFVDKEQDEELILLLRAHLVTNVPWVIISLFLAVFPLIALPLSSGLGLLSAVSGGLLLVGIFFWYMGIFTYSFISFLYWYFNVYIVTSERVVDVDWYSIVVRKVSSTQISKIQDASALQAGVLAGIFDFGNVEIQTAGAEENFEFTAVPHPQLVAKKIEELMQKEEDEMESGNGGGNV